MWRDSRKQWALDNKLQKKTEEIAKLTEENEELRAALKGLEEAKVSEKPRGLDFSQREPAWLIAAQEAADTALGERREQRLQFSTGLANSFVARQIR